MTAQQIKDPASGRRWNLVVLRPGEVSPGRPAYRAGALTEVEFYDAEQDPQRFGEHGQFVSSYSLDSLASILDGERGVTLDGGVPAWVVSHELIDAAADHVMTVLSGR